VRLLLSPHVDYERGGTTYAHAWRALAAACDADLFVVLGTAHATPDRLFTLTRRDFATPLGTARTDRPVVERLVGALGEDAVLGDEPCHDDEHSIELQLPWLRHVTAGRDVPVLPVLCSSVSRLRDPSAAVAPFLGALGRAVAGRRVCWVAGADLAHVGPGFGDRLAPTPAERASLAREDVRTLGFVARGDAPGFHRDAVRDDHRRRLCGTAPIYAALRMAGRGARILHHAQWSDGADAVSFAAAAG
jgi:AmmeMemoRadiSam system protein B